MTPEQEDEEYAAAKAAYQVALERLQKAKAPISARDERRREAARLRADEKHEAFMAEYKRKYETMTDASAQ